MKIKKRDIKSFSKSSLGRQLLKEISNLSIHSGSDNDNDDRICGFYKDIKTYLNISKPRAEQIGFTILNDLLGNSQTTIHTNPANYANGFTDDISYYTNTYREDIPPATYYDRNGPFKGNLRDKDFTDAEAYNLWKKHIQKVASIAGWTFVEWLDVNKINHDGVKLKEIYNSIKSKIK